MTIEMAVNRQRARVLREAHCEHVRQKPRHDRRSEHVVETFETSAYKPGIDVMEEVVHVLHCQRKIVMTQFIGQYC